MTQLHTAGEERFADVLGGQRSMPDTWYVGLYHDGEVSGNTTAGDRLTDDATVADITTEPTYDGPFAVQWPEGLGTELISTSATSGSLFVVDIQSALEFDVSSAESVVDAYYVRADFRSDVLGQTTSQPNLLWTGGLDAAYDLSEDETDVFPLEGVRFGLS